MKKFTKIFAMMLVVVMVVGMFSSVAFAAGGSTGMFSSQLNQGNATGTTEINTKMNDLGASAIQIIKTLGMIIAIAMVFIYAIKWMMATPQKKQELKERLWYLAIGVVLLVAGPQILDLIATAGNVF